MSGKRKSISKSLRFQIFTRDSFTCRYCGRQSDTVSLVIDHVIPVCQGGDNDPENLVTACFECNSGKAGKTIKQTAPTEADRLRIAQEMNEQAIAAKAAQLARESREQLRQTVCNFWCEVTGKESVDRRTLNIVTNYVSQFGADTVFGWIELAYGRTDGKDFSMGKYISGIKRNHLNEVMGEGGQDAY